MKILLFANTDWYLYNFRLSLANALRDAGAEVLLVSPSGPYGEQLLAMGFRWIAAPMERRSLHPIREPRLIAWLARLIRHERVEVVHGFTVKCAIYGAFAGRLGGAKGLVLAFTGLGYVFTSTDVRARLLKAPVRALMRLALAGSCTRVILQNPDDREMLLRAGLVDPSKTRLIRGSGVDCSRFRPPRENASSSRTFTVLLPARLLWDKGVHEYVTAARLLRDEGRSMRFLLAGNVDSGNPASVPEATIHEWVSGGIVEWLGHVSEMPALFNSVDVVVLPSYREGLPRGLIEAAAAGAALVTTDVPGCREVVQDGIDGLLVPVRNPSALARAIATLQDDPALRVRVAAAARDKALREFDERLVIDRTLSVYRELLPAVPRQNEAVAESRSHPNV